MKHLQKRNQRIITIITIVNTMMMVAFLIYGSYNYIKSLEYAQQLENCIDENN